MLTCLHRRVVGEHIMNQQRQLHANFNRIFNPASVIIKKSLTLTHKIIWTSIHFDMNIWAKDWPFTTLRRKYDFQKKKKMEALCIYIYIFFFGGFQPVNWRGFLCRCRRHCRCQHNCHHGCSFFISIIYSRKFSRE